MASEPRCKCCKGLFSLGAECVIITLTILHVILSTVELLIHLDVIHVPNSNETKSIVTTTVASTNSNTSVTPGQSYDPGGCDVSLIRELGDTVQVVRYVTLVLSAVFFTEIVCKVVYLKKYFFKDFWQVFDFLIIVISLGVEIAFFLEHEAVLCYHPATEAATFVIILRLWRIPRTCNIRRMEYKAHVADDHRYLRRLKEEKEKECKQYLFTIQNQNVELEYLKSVLRKNNLLEDDKGKIPNGNSPQRLGISSAINRIFQKDDERHSIEKSDKESVDKSEQISKDTKHEKNKLNEKEKRESAQNNIKEIDLERNDSYKNSRADDSGIEVKDSFRSEREIVPAYRKSVSHDDDVFCDSDGSEYPLPAKVQEVEVQIEEISRQKQLPSVTSFQKSEEDDEAALLRRKVSTQSAAYCENPGYDATDEVDADGTYRSPDGIPMTEL